MSGLGALRVSLPVALIFVSASAFGQDLAAADALFKRGVAAMKAGELETACPAIAESQRLDPRPGTLFTLAECEAKRGRIATATVHYGDYLALVEKLPAEQRAKHDERRKLAAAKHAELSPRVPKLSVRLPASAPAGTVVRRDGVELGEASIGVTVPVDPGERTFVVRTADGRERETRVSLAPGDRKSVELALPGGTDASDKAPSPRPIRADGAAATPGDNTVAYVIGGIGIAALALGATTGALVFSKKSTIDAHCVDVTCDRAGKDAADSAKSLGLVSTIAVGVGLAGVATSAVLLLTAPRAAETAWRVDPAVSTRGASLSFGASW